MSNKQVYLKESDEVMWSELRELAETNGKSLSRELMDAVEMHIARSRLGDVQRVQMTINGEEYSGFVRKREVKK